MQQVQRRRIVRGLSPRQPYSAELITEQLRLAVATAESATFTIYAAKKPLLYSGASETRPNVANGFRSVGSATAYIVTVNCTFAGLIGSCLPVELQSNFGRLAITSGVEQSSYCLPR